ncbi:hypothetical protein ID866_9847 [Astraeus odoratus]|nr:hypothetical protein ID866_9847 [Astraeus odoratus]
MTFLGVDEDRVVRQLKPDLQRLVDSIIAEMLTLVLAIVVCAVVYVTRQIMEEGRARELHAKRVTSPKS